MNFSVVTAAQRHGEFIAHLAAQRRALRKAQVVGVRRLPPADQARLFGNEPDVIAVANPPRLREGKQAFVNFFGASLPNLAQAIASGARLQTLRLRCPLGQLFRQCWLIGICGERRQPRSKRVLDAVSVVYEEFALFGEPPVRPGRGVIA
jgi:hypothetical protein